MRPSAHFPILPSLTAEEAAHSNAVLGHIVARIEAVGGFLPFDEFMELALYAPGLGYYSAGSIKLGPGGDFTTAPEISDLFSACVARQCAEILSETGGSMLELGAGTGHMATVILETLAAVHALPRQYLILEISADLRARQQARIDRLPAELRQRVIWLDRLPTEPLSGVVLANEVLDALPCERFVFRDSKVSALGVGRDAAGSLVECELAAPPALLAEMERIRGGLAQSWPEGYRSEISSRVSPWLRGVAASLKRGAMLLFDYGLPRTHYYHPQRRAGTLRCHFKQRAHDDALVNVGVQDITAWVDFTRVAEAADEAGLEVRGFATQAAFLLGTGIEQAIAGVTEELTRARLASEARQLLMPGEMGEVFKAMVLTRDLSIPLQGFAHQDLRASL